MKDELKEIEEWLRDISTPTGLSYSGDRTLSNSMVDHIIDYITNLQEENERLHIQLEDRAYEQIKFQWKDYKSRNEKAIEYIKGWQSFPHTNGSTHNELRNLLNILGDKNE